MTIRLEKSDAGSAIVLGDRFDFECVGPFRQSYENLKNIKEKSVAIDFRETRYIDSSALGMLINAKTFFEDFGVRVKLINTNEEVKKIFSISRFDKKFDIT